MTGRWTKWLVRDRKIEARLGAAVMGAVAERKGRDALVRAGVIIILLAAVTGGALELASTNFQQTLNSDYLLAHVFSHELLHSPYPISGWTFGAGTFWFPDYVLYLPLYLSFGNSGLSYAAYGVLWWISLGVAYGACLVALGYPHRLAWMAGLGSVSLLLLLQHVGSHGHVLWQLCLPAYHGGSILLFFVLLALVLNATHAGEWSRAQIVLVGLLLMLGLASNALLFFHIVAPIGVIYLWPGTSSNGVRPVLGRFLLAAAVATATVMLVRLALARMEIFFFGTLFKKWPLPYVIVPAVQRFLADFTEELCPSYLGLWLLAALGFGVSLWRLWRTRVPNGHGTEQLAALCGAWTLILGWATPVCAGFWKDAESFRYMFILLTLPLWLVVALGVLPFSTRPWFSAAATVCCTLIAGAVLAGSSRDIEIARLRFPKTADARALRDFLEQHGLQAGLCDYWNGHFLTIEWGGYDADGPYLGNICDKDFTYFWCNNAFRYFRLDPTTGAYREFDYQFIILDRLDRQKLGTRLGSDLAIAQVGRYEVALLTPDQSQRVNRLLFEDVKHRLKGKRWHLLAVSSPQRHYYKPVSP